MLYITLAIVVQPKKKSRSVLYSIYLKTVRRGSLAENTEKLVFLKYNKGFTDILRMQW